MNWLPLQRCLQRYTVMFIIPDMSSPCYSSSLEHKIFSIPSSSSPDSFTLRNHLPKPSAQQLGVPNQIYVFLMFRKRHLQPQQEVWYVETIPFCSFRLSNKSGRIHSSHGMQEVGRLVLFTLWRTKESVSSACWHMGKPYM